MEEISDLWLKFNEYSNKLAAALGRTSNIVGEYAEYLAHQYYGGQFLEISGSSADIRTESGKLYQVKSRKIKGTRTTQLNVIRSWDFDHLVVILFDADGAVLKALEVPVEVAKEYGAENRHQNGWVITTTRRFLGDHRSRDITDALSAYNKCNITITSTDPPDWVTPSRTLCGASCTGSRTMNDEQLDRSIRSIGKACFVKYFQEFSNTRIPREDLIEMLMNEEGYEESGSTTRVTQSRRIIKAGRADDALEIIANSRRVPYQIRKKAEDLRVGR